MDFCNHCSETGVTTDEDTAEKDGSLHEPYLPPCKKRYEIQRNCAKAAVGTVVSWVVLRIQSK